MRKWGTLLQEYKREINSIAHKKLETHFLISSPNRRRWKKDFSNNTESVTVLRASALSLIIRYRNIHPGISHCS